MAASIRWFWVLAALWAPWVQAGQACEDKPLTPEIARNTFQMALQVRDRLEAAGATVGLLARAGQDLSRYGLRYSHAGWVWRDHPDGRWMVVHLLNDCGTAVSDLYNEGLANFFADDMVNWEALLVIPSASVQKRLADILASDLPRQIHEPRYNMAVYPFATRYQNSNQWALELLAAAMMTSPDSDRTHLQSWLRDRGYAPTTLQIPALTRLGARVFRANVAFDDHPDERRYAGNIDTVSVESLSAFLRRVDLDSRLVVERLAPFGRGPL